MNALRPSHEAVVYQDLPWWTWLAPFFIFFAGTQISLLAKVMTGSSLFYFPLPFALVLIYWWGPRILIPFYINAVVCCGFWGLEQIELWPVFALPEAVFIFLSWLFFIEAGKGKPWLPNFKETISFLLLGILLPLVIYKFLLESIFVIAGVSPAEHYWNLFITTSFGDFISTFGISVPILYFASEFMKRKNLFIVNDSISAPNISKELSASSKKFEVLGLIIVVYLMSKFLDFVDYWFLYGIISLYIAIRFGFAITILVNTYILLLTYIIPVATNDRFVTELTQADQMLKTQLGTCLLYVFSIITARLMSDMKAAELRLNMQNKRFEITNRELEQTNHELDHFVYSVSHDLSAPLKSISGLVNISRISKDPAEHDQYMNLIEKSVKRLETFIDEVLDYSRNKRQAIIVERIMLKELCEEIMHDLNFVDGCSEVKVDLSGIESREIRNDKTRLKIILNNLLTNAIKFRKQMRESSSFIKVSSVQRQDFVSIMVEDNGEGIRPEFQKKIFEMFFRANERAKGSGLGLYIAREAARKIHADISVTSAYGEGTTFTIKVKDFGSAA